MDILTIGWREWLALPEFGLGCVQAKIDTSRRTSQLHAAEVESVALEGTIRMRFTILPIRGDERTRILAEAPLLEQRWINTAAGKRLLRPVVRTLLTLGKLTWPAEIALVAHEPRGYRLLLGRQTLDGRFLIDPKRSFLAGPPAVN